jgi:hypothetical protein
MLQLLRLLTSVVGDASPLPSSAQEAFKAFAPRAPKDVGLLGVQRASLDWRKRKTRVRSG